MKNAEPPHCAMDPDVDGQLRLSGSWTLSTALQSAQVLGDIRAPVRGLDARGIDQLDSAGVLQLLRYSRSAGLSDDALLFRDEHRALVCTIDEVADERPPPQRDYGVGSAARCMPSPAISWCWWASSARTWPSWRACCGSRGACA